MGVRSEVKSLDARVMGGVRMCLEEAENCRMNDDVIVLSDWRTQEVCFML